MMKPPDEPPPGGGTGPPGIEPLQVDAASTVTPLGMGDSGGGKTVKKMRSFAQIIADEKENRNILEIKIVRKEVEENGEMKPAKALTMDDVSALIFDVIGVKPQECLQIALYSSRFDTKEIKFKPGVDTTCYLTSDIPIDFKNHEITVTRQTANLTRVAFKNVPLNIPDEEILNLCSCYGDIVDSVVNYEKPSLNSRGVMGSTRYVDVKLTPGKQFENFYWLEGPLEGDRGSRITVLHTGQERQCSHCLRREGDCPGAGVGKVCYKIGTARGQMGDYMKHLYIHHNYMRMKMKFNQIQFPHLGSKGQVNDGFGHINVSEKVTDDHETVEEALKKTADAEKIAELESELRSARAKLNIKPKVVRTMDIPKELFDYDEVNDEIFVNDEVVFENFVDAKCVAQVDRDTKKLEFRSRVLEQVKHAERKKRSLSISSMASIDSPSRQGRRDRPTDDGEDSLGVDAKQSRFAKTPPGPSVF